MSITAADATASTQPGAAVRLRVLRIADVPGSQIGGMRRAMAETSDLLSERGHAIDHCFTEDMRTPGPARLRRILVPLSIPIFVLRLMARGRAPDVVEIHEPLGAPYALLRSITPRDWLPPLVSLSHGLEERLWSAQKDRWRRLGQRGPLKSRILAPLTLVSQARLAVRLADAVVVLSTEDRDHLVSRRAKRADRIHRIDNGVEGRLLSLHRSVRVVGNEVVLLFVGSWIDRKGTPELSDAFVQLCADHPDVRLVVAGSGVPATEVLAAFPDAVRARVDAHESVTRDELRHLLGRADVFVLASWFEGMPLSLLEALAAGLPSVATAICGTQDVIRPGDSDRDGGRLVPPHDAGTLHAALDVLVRDQALRIALGARARERAHEFTWDRSADALERVYLSLASASR